MKAIIAFYRGLFNSCDFTKDSDTEYTVKLVDDVHGLVGTFKGTFDANGDMVDFKADSDMKPIKRVSVPKPPIAEEIPE